MAKTSRRPGPHEATLGAVANWPPTLSQLNHPPASYQRCHIALSRPRATITIRPLLHDPAAGWRAIPPPSGPHEATPGPEVSWPPSVSVRTQVSPTPVNATVCGLPAPFVVIVDEPVRDPVAVGRNVTLIVQLASGARLVPQLFAWL